MDGPHLLSRLRYQTQEFLLAPPEWTCGTRCGTFSRNFPSAHSDYMIHTRSHGPTCSRDTNSCYNGQSLNPRSTKTLKLLQLVEARALRTWSSIRTTGPSNTSAVGICDSHFTLAG